MSQPILWKGSLLLEEQPKSPHWSFTREKGAIYERTLRGPFELCMLARPLLNSFGVGTLAGLKVVDVDVTREKLDIGTLYYRLEGALTPAGELPELPPDRCSINPQQQELSIMRHPRYALIPDNVKDACNSYVQSNSDDDRQKFLNTIISWGIDNITTIASDLVDKLRTGLTHFVLFLPTYTWVQNALILPPLDSGGYPQRPYGPVEPPAVPSIPPRVGGWLRKADEVQWTGSFWEITRSWQAGIDIDPTIYPVTA